MLTDDTLTMSDDSRVAGESWFRRISFRKVLSVEWLGQTVASVCWICSVLAYGILGILKMCTMCTNIMVTL